MRPELIKAPAFVLLAIIFLTGCGGDGLSRDEESALIEVTEGVYNRYMRTGRVPLGFTSSANGMPVLVDESIEKELEALRDKGANASFVISLFGADGLGEHSVHRISWENDGMVVGTFMVFFNGSKYMVWGSSAEFVGQPR